VWGLLAVCPLVAGCEKDGSAPEEVQPGRDLPEPRNKKVWLGKLDTASPQEWLAQHVAVRKREGVERDTAEIPALLAGASRLFGETPRMIVNRAVQLETMLAAHGIDENALDLIAGLSSTVEKRGEAEGFGARCQHYYILRVFQQNSREQAFTAMKRGEFKGR
jgi:hypothetical protein